MQMEPTNQHHETRPESAIRCESATDLSASSQKHAEAREDEPNGSSRRQESFRRMSNAGSLRRGSLSFSCDIGSQILEDIQDKIDAQTGDSGRFSSAGYSRSCSLKLGFDGLKLTEDGAMDLPDDALTHVRPFRFHDSNAISPISPLPSEIASPLSSDGLLYSGDKSQSASQVQSNQTSTNQLRSFPPSLEYISCLAHLADFGIIGVLTRYLLQKLFGPAVANITSDQTPLYLDLPSNMVGSLLMGWLGIVFKRDIIQVSEMLAIGLSTGFLGSLTTFSGWNQKMVELAAKGRWVHSMVGILLGMLLAVVSILMGVDTARGFKWLLNRYGPCKPISWKVDSWRRHIWVLVGLLLTLGIVWAICGVLLRSRLEDDRSSSQLLLACLVAPPGVWLRWLLARLNGQGLGRNGSMKWVPFGTLLANVLAACIMAALATIRKEVDTKRCDIIISGIQLGFLGCLSTVSTFVAEFYAMRQSKHPWRAYVYSAVTIILSFALGTLLYSVPMWTKGYQ